jgi:protein-S-isoprenylcysteine O-methyltransferase Ste14
MAQVGNFLFRYRNALFPLACALLLLPGRQLLSDPIVAAGTGALVAALGQCIRAMTIGLRYIIRGGREGRVYAEDLVTGGMYALCRNPMYIGNILIAVGVAIASNSATTLVVTMPLVTFAYVAIVAAEEQFLAGEFGEAFRRYCDTVPRWIPRFADLRRESAGLSFRWRRVIVKEYGTPFAWISAVCLVALYNLWRADALSAQDNTVRGLVAAMVLVTIFWVGARTLKKTRLVVAD